MLYGAPITDPVAEQAADERILNELHRERFLGALHEAEHSAWLYGVEVDHTAIAFGDDAHFSWKISCPDCCPVKFAAALEAMARAMRKAVA